MLFMSAASWSVITVATPFLAYLGPHTLALMTFSRFLMGLLQGKNVNCCLYDCGCGSRPLGTWWFVVLLRFLADSSFKIHPNNTSIWYFKMNCLKS